MGSLVFGVAAFSETGGWQGRNTELYRRSKPRGEGNIILGQVHEAAAFESVTAVDMQQQQG